MLEDWAVGPNTIGSDHVTGPPKHIKQLAQDTNINNDEALHPIELVAKSYRL